MKLKTLLQASMASALLIPLVISTLFFTISLRLLIDNRVEEKELPTTLESLRNAIELELQESIIISKSIAENTFILDWMAASEPRSSLGDVTRYLRNIKQNNSAITAYIVSAQTGNYYNVDGVLKTLSPSADTDQWFYSFINGDREFELSLDIDQTTRQSAVFINYKLKQGNRATAVGGIGRSLQTMTELINRYRVGETGQIYLVDASGTVMLHRNSNAIGQSLTSIIGDADSRAELLRTESFSLTSFNRDGEDYLAASLGLKSLDWQVVAELPRSELYSDLNTAIISNLLLMLFIAIVFLVLVTVMAKRIINPLKDVSNAINDISQRGGDLTARLPESGQDELAELSARVNTFIAKLQRMCLDIRTVANDIDKVTVTVNQVMESAADKTSQQQIGTEMVATAVNQMGATVQEIAANANRAAELSREAEGQSDAGLSVVRKTVKDITSLNSAMDGSVKSVEHLASEIKSISTVLEVIKGISEQTNLLALNAAIEAARAGEQGRGFAVVADEVRTLAQRTAHSTEEINEMIVKLEKSANETVNAIQSGSQLTQSSVSNAKDTGTTISNMAEKISAIANTNVSVAAATEEQSTVTEEINKNITEISEFSTSTLHDIQQCEAMCAKLKQQVTQLTNSLKQFTLE